MSIFNAVANAPLYGSGNYFTDGRYLLEIEDVLIVDSQRKVGAQYGIVQCKIHDCTNDRYTSGDSVSWRVDLSQPSAPSNLRQFCLALGQEVWDGFQNEHINADFVKKVFDAWTAFKEEEELQRVMLKAEAFTVKTRAGTPFTKVVWSASHLEPEGEK